MMYVNFKDGQSEEWNCKLVGIKFCKGMVLTLIDNESGELYTVSATKIGIDNIGIE